ncbi:MAG: hypothetical protein WBC29_02680 [Candidatus Moraniibacteriota bacterium]
MMKFLANFFQAFPRYFFLLFVVFFAVGFFVFYESFRMYRAESELIVISHGPTVSADEVAVTLSHIPSTLSFYDRLREDHSNVSDPWTGDSPADRKLAWNRVIDAASVSGSSVIHLSVVGSDPSQASALLSASIETLYGFSGRLYNRNTEAEMRLLEDVIVRSVVTNAWALFLLSAVCSALAALLISLLLQNSENFLKRATLPDISLFRAKYLPAHLGGQGKEGIRPVGSFPDITQEESHLPSEVSIISRESASSTLSAPPTEEISPSPHVNDIDELALSVAEPIENNVDKESSPSRASSESVSGEEKRESYESRMSDEPEDIWEKPRFAPVGRMRIGMKQTGEGGFSQKNASEVAPADVRNDTVSEKMPEKISAEEKRQETVSEQVRTTSHRNETRAGVPGNLTTVSAQDFTWDKFLFQDEENSSKKEEKKERVDEGESESKTEVVSALESAVKHEPTPEELKARLNQLLRGEL